MEKCDDKDSEWFGQECLCAGCMPVNHCIEPNGCAECDGVVKKCVYDDEEELENNKLMERVCEKCIERNDKCINEVDKCCIMELKYRKPSADAEFIFYFCCILMCGFNKHRCSNCIITASGIIRFVKVKKVDSLPDESQTTLLQAEWEKA